jgi:hypothetical protein
VPRNNRKQFGGSSPRPVVSRISTLVGADRHPSPAQAVMAPLICWCFSRPMFRYLLLDHAVPATRRSLAAARSGPIGRRGMPRPQACVA